MNPDRDVEHVVIFVCADCERSSIERCAHDTDESPPSSAELEETHPAR